MKRPCYLSALFLSPEHEQYRPLVPTNAQPTALKPYVLDLGQRVVAQARLETQNIIEEMAIQ